jgi:hypothetical protein
MTNVWLIFFKNKFKEIGGKLLIILMAIVICLGGFGITCGFAYGIGYVSNLFPSYINFLHNTIKLNTDLDNVGYGFFNMFICGLTYIVIYFGCYKGPIIFKKWIQDNWELAKIEAKRNQNVH